MTETKKPFSGQDMPSVLHVIPSLDPALGGTVECVRQISHGLVKRGCRVDIVTLNGSVANADPMAAKVISVGTLFSKYGFSPTLLFWLVTNCRNYDLIIVNGIWQFHTVATILAAGWKSIPVLVYSHGMLTEYCSHSKYLKKLAYWLLVERRALFSARGVLCTSLAELESSRLGLPGADRLKFVYVGNGVEGIRRTAEHCFISKSRVENLYSDRKYLLFLGRLNPIKGVDMLVRVFAANDMLREQYSLVIAGPGDRKYSEDLVDLSKQLGVDGEIHWLGPVYGEAKWNLILGADVFVLPSHHENFSIVCAEALSVATPVITTNKVGLARELKSYDAGLVCNDDEESLAEVLRYWVKLSDEQKLAMRVSARRCYDVEFSVERPVERILNYFQQLSELNRL